MPKVVLTQLRDVDGLDITSVTSMVDSGGSTGVLRKSMNVLPPGDIRRHVLALSKAEEWKKKLWELRFNDGNSQNAHVGHKFGNLFIAGLEHILGDFEKVLDIVHDFMKVKGRCLPATLDKVQLCAELQNGQIIVGEHEIDVPKEHDGSLRIKKVWLEPEGRAYGPVIEAIEKADYIIVGPGDVYSSLICCFLPAGISAAMRKTQAEKILIAPIMTKYGETAGMWLEDIVGVIEKYMGTRFDYVIYNTRIPPRSRIEEHRKLEPAHIDLVKPKAETDDRFIGMDLLRDEGAIIHDPEKVKHVLFDLLEISKTKL